MGGRGSGVAGRFDAAQGRYEVAVEGANFKMLLKPAKLQLQDEADTDDTMTAGPSSRRFAYRVVRRERVAHPVCVYICAVAATGI